MFAVASGISVAGCTAPYLANLRPSADSVRDGWLARFGLALMFSVVLASVLATIGAAVLSAAAVGGVMYVVACQRLQLIDLLSLPGLDALRVTRVER